MKVTNSAHNLSFNIICWAGSAFEMENGTSILPMHLFDHAISLNNEIRLFAITCLLMSLLVHYLVY